MNTQLRAHPQATACRKVEVEAEPVKLDTSGRRPLRPAQLRELGLMP